MDYSVSRRHGFTLIELSIVLVIIGLIAGGIMVGRDLIQAAKNRSVISDIEKFTTAVMTFKAIYNAIPGDMSNATTFWGADASCPQTPASSTPHTATCNGTGNGYIGDSSDHASDPGYMCESFRFWQQLANAGLVAGSYTGTSKTTNCLNQSVQIGLNAPASSVSNAAYFPIYLDASDWNLGGGPVSITYFNRNGFILATLNQFNSIATKPALSAGDAMSIDTKIDDGNPATGTVLSLDLMIGTDTLGCTTSPWSLPSNYDPANSTIACSLFFAGGF